MALTQEQKNVFDATFGMAESRRKMYAAVEAVLAMDPPPNGPEQGAASEEAGRKRSLSEVCEELCPGVRKRNWPAWAGPYHEETQAPLPEPKMTQDEDDDLPTVCQQVGEQTGVVESNVLADMESAYDSASPERPCTSRGIAAAARVLNDAWEKVIRESIGNVHRGGPHFTVSAEEFATRVLIDIHSRLTPSPASVPSPAPVGDELLTPDQYSAFIKDFPAMAQVPGFASHTNCFLKWRDEWRLRPAAPVDPAVEAVVKVLAGDSSTWATYSDKAAEIVAAVDKARADRGGA